MGHHLFSEKFALLETEKGEGMAPIVLEGDVDRFRAARTKRRSATAENTGLPSAESAVNGTLGEEGDVGEERSRVGSRKTRLGLLFVRSFCIFLEMAWVFCTG